MIKIGLLFKRLIKSPIVTVPMTGLVLLWGAYKASDEVQTFWEKFMSRQLFARRVLILMAFFFLLGVGKELYKRKKNKKIGREAYEQSTYNSNVNSAAYEIVITFLGSTEFKSILNRHLDNVRVYFDRLRNSLDARIDQSITEQTLKQFDKVRGDAGGQKRLLAATFRSLSDMPGIEAFLRKEHRACLDALRDYLVRLIRSNAMFSHYSRFTKNVGANVAPEFKVDPADIAFDIGDINSKMASLNLQRLYPKKDNMHAQDLTAASLLAAGLTADEIRHIVHDVLAGEAADQILDEVLDYAASFIPVVGQVFVVFKIFRFIYSMRDRSEDLAQLKQELYAETVKFYDGIELAACEAIQSDSIEYLKKLTDLFYSNFEKAEKARKNTKWYL